MGRLKLKTPEDIKKRKKKEKKAKKRKMQEEEAENNKHEYCYVYSLDDGTFTIGTRAPGKPPLPQEQLTPIPVNEKRFALKTGFGRYVTVEKDGLLRGCMEAYGPNETFEPVFQDGKCALQAVGVNCFISFNEQDQLVAVDKTASDEHMLAIRC